MRDKIKKSEVTIIRYQYYSKKKDSFVYLDPIGIYVEEKNPYKSYISVKTGVPLKVGLLVVSILQRIEQALLCYKKEEV